MPKPPPPIKTQIFGFPSVSHKHELESYIKKEFPRLEHKDLSDMGGEIYSQYATIVGMGIFELHKITKNNREDFEGLLKTANSLSERLYYARYCTEVMNIAEDIYKPLSGGFIEREQSENKNIEYSKGQPTLEMEFTELSRRVRHIEETLRQAIGRLPKASGGRPSNDQIVLFSRRLANIFDTHIAGFYKGSKSNTKPLKEYRVDFVSCVLEYFVNEDQDDTGKIRGAKDTVEAKCLPRRLEALLKKELESEFKKRKVDNLEDYFEDLATYRAP